MTKYLLSVLLCARALTAQADPAASLPEELKRFMDVFNVIDTQAADPANWDQAIYEGALPSMLRTLDPHSSFFDAAQFAQLQQMQRSEAKGFGTIVSIVPGRVIVLQTMDGAPAAKAGLNAGDEILAINNIALNRLEPDQLIQLLGYARQQPAVLDVRKPGNVRLFRLTLTPTLVDSPSVDRAFLLSPGVGYLRITGFEEATGKLVNETIEKLGGPKLERLIVDLRDNPGGAVQSAAETAALFLEPDQLIFTIKPRHGDEQPARAPKLNQPYKFRLALLINGKSASAAEILAGALQDHDRAVIVGESSYGKGIVQNVFTLSQNTGLALTVAFYYTPSGRSIQKPLASGSLDVAAHVKAENLPSAFHTDKGRAVEGGGGIQPDEVVMPPVPSRLTMVLDATGFLTTFASEYIQTHEIPENFEVTANMLDQLQSFLGSRQIQPGPSDWLRDRGLIQSKLKQEITNLKFGVAKGDEIEMRRDPIVVKALERLR
jgi:carboxyl-terminal processing protease